MQTEKRYLTTKQAARYVGFSFKTLETWRTTGRGPEFLRLENGHIRYELRELDAWLHINRPGQAA